MWCLIVSIPDLCPISYFESYRYSLRRVRYLLRVIGRTLYFDTVYRLVANFKSGLQQLKDAARPGSRATTMTKSNMKKKSTICLKKMPALPYDSWVPKHVILTLLGNVKKNQIP